MKSKNFSMVLAPFLILLFLLPAGVVGQMITGVWKGKINRQKVELKIIQNGDSLTGTSYYYESPANYRRYSIKGYFDANTNSAVWWDDMLLEEKSGRFNISVPGKVPMLSRADFNCPGDGKMMLDGISSKKEEEPGTGGNVDLDKTGRTQFEDEWDFVIDNYTVGANDPDIIDSVNQVYSHHKTIPEQPVVVQTKPVTPPPVIIKEKEKTIAPPIVKTDVPVFIPPVPPTIREKYTTRIKTFIKEIPVSGDSIELRFYDNAEIDGDSISLFLNDELIFKNIRLTGNAYIIKLAVSALGDKNELTMVAENLGTIPPNTSYMVAIVNNQRFDAYLSSNEGSSAMIRFIKQQR